uniref:RING-type domain-containing protein n=1 Tax=Syphacia muris TaxID=451379 RepID=A0A0N5ANF4_9BILA
MDDVRLNRAAHLRYASTRSDYQQRNGKQDQCISLVSSSSFLSSRDEPETSGPAETVSVSGAPVTAARPSKLPVLCERLGHTFPDVFGFIIVTLSCVLGGQRQKTCSSHPSTSNVFSNGKDEKHINGNTACENQEKEFECIICLDKAEDAVGCLFCSQVFGCRKCASSCAGDNHNRCPLCRALWPDHGGYVSWKSMELE